jgi:hypothetical protein
MVLLVGLSLAPFARAEGGREEAPSRELQRVTLYALNKYPNDSSRALFSFRTGTFVRGGGPWDLNYGSLYVGDEWDWFSVSTAKTARTVARDLGAHDWGDIFDVPALKPFPKLAEGQNRTITVDSSGADGADGAQGAPGEPGRDADGELRPGPLSPVASATPRPLAPPKEKRTGGPKVDPVFVKAILGHMYVIRVVDGDTDFYVLFRVEALVRGDNCAISWMRIPPPAENRSE